MDNIVAGAVIVGIVNGIRLLPQKTLVMDGFVAFVIALLLGIIFGFLHMFGLNIETGIVTALASSGLYQVAKKVGGQ